LEMHGVNGMNFFIAPIYHTLVFCVVILWLHWNDLMTIFYMIEWKEHGGTGTDDELVGT
jgi:hypothetical protein